MAVDIPSVPLDNGLVIHFNDQSNRYFGDFHRVCISVWIELPKTLTSVVNGSPQPSRWEKTLEKMGVPGDAVEEERQSLIASFLRTTRSYLESDEFPQRLLARLQQEKNKPIFLRNL